MSSYHEFNAMSHLYREQMNMKEMEEDDAWHAKIGILHENLMKELIFAFMAKYSESIQLEQLVAESKAIREAPLSDFFLSEDEEEPELDFDLI